MQIDLADRRALVTGSTKGIGYAAALGLAVAGAEVVINGRKEKTVEAAVSKLRAAHKGAKVRGISADVGTAEGCESLVKQVGELDILVNNAGIFGPRDFFETDDSVWEQYFAVNVMSGVRLSRALSPGMRERGWGRIIFISSESSINIPADMIHYGVTKTANLAVSRGLAKRLAGTGVTVNAVLPGPTLSDGMTEMLQEEHERSQKSYEQLAKEFIKSERPSSVLQRAATTEEVANMIVYVASPLSSATTGASLRVDGGVVETI